MAKAATKTAAAVPKDAEPEKPASEQPKPAGLFSKRNIILLGVPVMLAGIGAGLWLTGILPRLLGLGHDDVKTEAATSSAPIFIDLPDIVTNLNGNPHRPNYLKLQARVEVMKQDDVLRVTAAMPRLLDMFQTYLREMRPEELRGSAGTYRLREELIGRANIAVAPARITDLLFTQMLIQ